MPDSAESVAHKANWWEIRTYEAICSCGWSRRFDSAYSAIHATDKHNYEGVHNDDSEEA